MSGKPSLVVVTNCTDRKTGTPTVRMRDLPFSTEVEARAAEWWARLASAGGERNAAEATYAGAHWAVIRQLRDAGAAQGWTVSTWVVSAGYGLITAATPIVSYSATFATGHADSVGKSLSDVRRWWGAVSRLSIGSEHAPRSLEALAASEPRSVLLLVASGQYVRAVREDLARAVSVAQGRTKVIVVSERSLLGDEAIAPVLIASRHDMQTNPGGPLVSLHARVAREIVLTSGAHGFELGAVRRVCEGLISPESVGTVARAPQNDEEIRRYIRTALLQDRRLKYTPLLQRLRRAGLACEMSRFRRLFTEESENWATHAC